MRIAFLLYISMSLLNLFILIESGFAFIESNLVSFALSNFELSFGFFLLEPALLYKSQNSPKVISFPFWSLYIDTFLPLTYFVSSEHQSLPFL